MNKFLNVSLQTKILGLIITLLLFVIILLTGIFAYFESTETKDETKKLALQTAKTVSLMPAVKEELQSNPSSTEIQTIAEQIREQAGAASVIVTNRDGICYSYPDSDQIGKTIQHKDDFKALVFGGNYVTESTGEMGPAIRGKAPIIVDFGNYKKVMGVVTVEFLKKDLHNNIANKITKIILFSSFVLGLGIIGGVYLAKSIRKDTLGLEPYEIAALFRERSAILLSIREGIISIDQKGLITMMNTSAKEMLGLEKDAINQPIETVFPQSTMKKVLETGVIEKNIEMELKDKIVIVNSMPIIENGRIVGVVASFRDKTELKKMIDTLSEVRKYSEDLRAQTHEFTNKLYVLLGLLELGHYDEAIEMIKTESTIHQNQNRILFEQIHDAKVQAILLGKLGKASEKKINFTLDPNSSIEPLPPHIGVSQLVTIIGNLIDNAFEAVAKQGKKEVLFFITDVGNDIVIEVVDNGPGISDEQIETIFKKGFSMKGPNRGYGLSNVKEAIDELEGTIEVSNQKDHGAIFTVFIPKKIGEQH
ncbi:sensor histidine kinase [Fictibacillus sp. Mic-4]|uniref:ATP-binding protein n=1 Tax=Fictibacillus TaxID=1329200 RepID=UPI0003F6896A|nr:sensor histidine kinase [Fictibacillus gelatini]